MKKKKSRAGKRVKARERADATPHADDAVSDANAALLALFAAVVAGDEARVAELVVGGWSLGLASRALAPPKKTGATRPSEVFFDEIRHYAYAGDTALHIAAAAHKPRLVDVFLKLGGDVHARNRRGATPLHYASDNGPVLERAPRAQAGVITRLLKAGADVDAVDDSGVTPLHRAVRNRCAAAVAALLDGGADREKPNKSGNTALDLARMTTGKSGSGSDDAKEQQRKILALLATSSARSPG